MSNLSEKEISNILDELNNVRPEVLNDNAKRLFNAIMQIADERDEYINLYTNLKQIEQEHQKINGELREELKREKEKNKELEFKYRTRILGKYGEVSLEELIKDKFISQDKIREKIEEVKSLENVSIADMLESEKEFCIDILKELL